MAIPKTEWDTQIELLESTKRLVDAQLANVKQSRAEFLCPFKVGDVIERNGHKAKVTRIRPDDYEPGYILFGSEATKTGFRKHEGGLWSWEQSAKKVNQEG